MPKAVPRSLPEKADAIRAREVANMTAPPTTWAARARLSINDEVDSPHTSEEAEKIPSQTETPSRRPNSRPTTPAVRRKAARVSEYASITHWRSLKLACSDRWMSGSATLTTVMSNSSMKVAVQTAMRVHHLRSSPGMSGSFRGEGGVYSKAPYLAALIRCEMYRIVSPGSGQAPVVQPGRRVASAVGRHGGCDRRPG